ncbi:hypothetical protein [Seleniivibrio woodruffii]|uniref:hypothetical protein n=1 Tax=Seleniivibrio woodruffii TaxID=1078050 RepID=UPI002409C162|nr:hypothetical protein [Seleniivibrio woodruffii]
MLILAVYSCSLLFASVYSASAFEDGTYTTPDNWQQQVTPGQFRQSVTGIGLTKDSKLYLSLTTRYRLKSDDYADDQDLYQYLRVSTDAVKLGQGTVRFSAFGRFADDIDGYSDKSWPDKYFYSQRDGLDTELEANDYAPRLYHGYIRLDGVVGRSVVNLGRFYLNHLNTFQLDGADATFSVTDIVSVYAFGGMPVSYYYDLDSKDHIYGGGVSLNYRDSTKVGAEYAYLDVQDINDDYTKLSVVQSIPHGTVVLGYSHLNDAGTFNANADFEIVKTGTLVSIGYEGMYDNVDSDKTYVVNPLTYSLLPQSKYSKYSAAAYQPFLKHFIAGVNYEGRSVQGDENFDNRNYNRYGAKFDINGLPSDNTYISFTVDRWDIGSTPDSRSSSKAEYGVQISQKITDKVDVWLGSSFNRYEYDYSTDKRKDSVRSYYIGGSYQPAEVFSVMADLSREDTDFYDDTDSDLGTSYRGEIWVNLVF